MPQLYQLGFKKIDFPAEIFEYPFMSDNEIVELYKKIRMVNSFSFPYSYVSSYDPFKKQITYDKDIADEYSLKFNGIAKQSVFKVALTRSVIMWAMQCSPYKDDSIWEEESYTKAWQEQINVRIVMTKIFTWHSIKDDFEPANSF